MSSAVGDIRVKYKSRKADYEERVAQSQNLALRIHEGLVDSSQQDLPVSDGELWGSLRMASL